MKDTFALGTCLGAVLVWFTVLGFQIHRRGSIIWQESVLIFVVLLLGMLVRWLWVRRASGR